MPERAIKCKVVSSGAFPEKPVQRPVNDRFAALMWIEEIGFQHVADSDCDLLRCKSAKAYIDDGYIIWNGKKAVFDCSKIYPKIQVSLTTESQPS